MSSKKKILIVDDDEMMGDILGEILTCEGYQVKWVGNGNDALTALNQTAMDIVLLDLRLPDINGNEVLKRILETNPLNTVIMMSGHGTIQTAIEATRLGAYDWLEKPLEKNRVLLTVRNAIEKSNLLKERELLLSEAKERYKMVGTSPSLQKIYSLIDKVAPTKATVLITGESGTGKELVARAIHINSTRASLPFIHMNCSAIPETLIEGELFGHVRGTFTGAERNRKGKFQLADQGTLFLDEIGDLSLAAQAKILIAIETGDIATVGTEMSGKVDVRVICATNKNLNHKIAEGTFRDDLLNRINVIEINIQPLKERPDDILPLAYHFLETFCTQNNIEKKRLTPDAEAIFLYHPWKGNVRELRNFIEKLVILVDEQEITASIVANLLSLPQLELDPSKTKTFKQAKESFEKNFITHSLMANDWNISKTAESLQIERSVFYKKLDKYGIKKSQKVDN